MDMKGENALMYRNITFPVFENPNFVQGQANLRIVFKPDHLMRQDFFR